ncbi:MAG TPA: type II secretion system protein [bacterium]|nr:type II secretion system protein [bacterium]
MKFYKDKKGFTLAELLVVMVIIIILTGVALVAVSDNSSRSQLKRSILDVAVVMREMQNSAMTGQMQSGTVPVAYGLYISDDQTFQFFQDLNDNEAWDSGETIKTYELEPRVTFDMASFTPTACHATNGCTIISPVPLGTFCYDGDNSTTGDSSCSADSVTMVLDAGTLTDSLIFNTFSGKISY